MKFFKDLSKREKILIYILTLLLTLFVYVYFIRDSILMNKNVQASNYCSKEDYNLLINKYNEEKLNLDSNNLFLENIEGSEKSFGKNLDLEKLNQEGKYNIKSYNISNVMMEDREGLKGFYIDKDLILSGDLENIISFLEFIKSKSKLFIKDINLNRIDEQIFDARLIIREYTLKEVPYTGISYKHNNQMDSSVKIGEDDKSLLSALYGKEEITNPPNSNYSKGASKKASQTITNKEEDITENLTEKTMETPIEKEDTPLEEAIDYKFIDDNNKAYNKDLNLLDENYYFNSTFVNENFELIKEVSNISDLIKNESKDILEFEFRNKLVFSDLDLKIDENINKVSFELTGPKGLEAKIYFLDKTKSIYTVDISKNIDGNEVISVDLNKDYKYPITLESLIISEDTWENIIFRNLIVYEK